MKATLSNYRQSPRKMRLLADMVRGASVARARALLSFTPKRAAEPMRKLIESAAANAEANDGACRDRLYIKTITVNEGFTLFRFMPRARGRATPLRKRTSRVYVELGENTNFESGSVNKGSHAQQTADSAEKAQ